jgi:hypothetical protein
MSGKSIIGGLKEAIRHAKGEDVGGREYRICNCIGPQNGEPLCPCRMGAVKIVNGRYVEVIDRGPAPLSPEQPDGEKA